MRRSRRSLQVPRRHSIFIGVEGARERTFARFLEKRCNLQYLPFAPGYPSSAGGGDSVAIVENAVRYLSRRAAKDDYHRRLVLLDEARIEQERNRGRDAVAVARLALQSCRNL